MTDLRITKLAEVLVNYSLELKQGDKFELRASPNAKELAVAVYEEAIHAGAYVIYNHNFEELDELLLKYGTDEQIEFISPVEKLIVESFNATIWIGAATNTRYLAGIDARRISQSQKAQAGLTKIFMERSAKKELRWCYTRVPTNADAQDANMSLRDYEEFVYGAGMLNEEDPVAYWKTEAEKQRKLINWLKGRDKVVLKGENVDVSLSIKDRTFEECAGKINFPDGEIFTGPVEDSVNGWIRFKYPAIYAGQEINDIELWFENGKIVKEKANKNEELLTSTLNTDAGSRFLGEWGIGTNYGIQKFTKNMLFDEKIGGTIHFAVGASYPETGGRNESGVHWDMLCDMTDSEIIVDGDLFYKNGKPINN